MLGITQATEAFASVVHILINLSVIAAHLVANDPLGAVDVAVIGCLCLVAVTLVACGCELVRWKVRQYTRKRELPETKAQSRQLRG
jgi:hypothetical protein